MKLLTQAKFNTSVRTFTFLRYLRCNIFFARAGGALRFSEGTPPWLRKWTAHFSFASPLRLPPLSSHPLSPHLLSLIHIVMKQYFEKTGMYVFHKALPSKHHREGPEWVPYGTPRGSHTGYPAGTRRILSSVTLRDPCGSSHTVRDPRGSQINFDRLIFIPVIVI